MNETKETYKATEEQIRQWKEKHGDVYEITVDGRRCYLRKPNRRELSYASVAGKSDPMRFNEIILNQCWLEGDEEIKTDDSLFLGVSAQIATLVEVKEAEIKKL
ncbi:MAG: hypothetical protein VZQ98_02955 [Bacteroidales bacterium]|jgi:hypothetical protein|nr:hypothetical protein [Bacteroidales bacterium]